MSKPKLNPVARQCVSDLRSGKDKQGKDMLHNINGKFCCLGVLCDRYVKKFPSAAKMVKINGTVVEYEGCFGALPNRVRKWVGLNESNGEMDNHKTLSGLNDSGRSFKEIADLIESQPAGLFKP